LGTEALWPPCRTDQPVPRQLSVEAGQAVQGGQPRTIDFGVGYRWRSNESSLLLAVKKPMAAEAGAKK